jgi:hypothetical protein
MNENLLSSEVDTQSDDIDISVSDSTSESEVVLPGSDRTDEQSEVAADQNQEEPEEEEKPSSTVIQVTEDEDSENGYTVSELDVNALNDYIGAKNEEVRSVTPTSNDYYAFIEGDIYTYFQGIMDNYPLNDYKAVHLRHWVQNGQYYSYYDDYYYLWFDYPARSAVELIRYNGESGYHVNVVQQNDLNSPIVYGSMQGQSDLRKGVSHVQEMAFLGSVCVVFVLYMLGAFFRHLKR